MTKSLIVIVLDESESLNRKKSEIINGFNTFIDVQRKVECDVGRVILIKFNSKVSLSLNCHGLESIPYLTGENYNPYGRTALTDAVVWGIQLAGKTQEKDETVMFVIITDGKENASERYNSRQMNDMIQDRNKRNGWNFFYIGVEPQEWSRNSGMDVCDCVQFDGAAPGNSFRKAEQATLGVRTQYYSSVKAEKNESNQQLSPLFRGSKNFAELRNRESNEKTVNVMSEQKLNLERNYLECEDCIE